MSTTTNPPPRRATIEDVAQRAGVSVATVSRALRGLPNVASTTRTRVTEVATELKYSPHPGATRLAAGRTRTITVAVPTLNGWYFSGVVAGAEAVCNEAGYEFQVVGIASAEEEQRLLREDTHLERRTDGLLVVDLHVSEADARSLRARGLSLATVGTATPGSPSVMIDDVDVGRIATEHLLGLGHHRIGVIGGLPHDPLSFDVPRARKHGHEQALRDAGLHPDATLFRPGDFGIDGGQEAMAALMDLDDPPSGVFAMSDEMAFGALMELRQRGLSAPADVSIIGVDDHEFARVIELTTIRQDVPSHGANAARLLIRSMEDGDGGPNHAVRHHSPVELIVRGTTAPPA